ncbi:MAG TPA: hypothetical protein VL652_34735 [Kutzneria sp.]|jgi:hypothetical protein|nr:hypothetical protein [Kutzneria sp.]
MRDVGCLLVGLGGIVHQEATGSVSPALLAVYTTLLGVPGAVGLLQLLRPDPGRPEPTDTTGPSSPSAPERQPLDSS